MPAAKTNSIVIAEFRSPECIVRVAHTDDDVFPYVISLGSTARRVARHDAMKSRDYALRRAVDLFIANTPVE